MREGDEKIRILFISHSADIGGAEQCLLNLVRHLNREKFRPFVVFPREGKLKQEIESLGVETFLSAMDWWIYPAKDQGEHHWHQLTSNFFQQIIPLVKIIEREDIDIVHTNTSVVWSGAFAAKIAGIPHLWHLHEILDEHPSLRPYHPLATVYSIFGHFSDRIAVVSRSIQEKLLPYILSEKIAFIPNGIEGEKFQSVSDIGTKGVRDQLGLTQNDLIVGTVGNIVKEKGYDILIEAARILHKRNSNVHFIVAGAKDDEYLTNSLEGMVSEKGLSKVFHFLGYRKDVSLVLRAINLYVNSSLTEASPLSVMEAMAASKPVLASQCGGLSDIVIDGETGYLVKPGDPEQLAETMYTLLMNAEQMASFGKAGAERAKKFFDIRESVFMFEREYKQLMPKKSTHQPDPTLRIISDVFNSVEKEIRTLHEEIQAQQEQIRVQQEEILQLRHFVEKVKRTKMYRLYKRLRNL